ncbi:MAG: hypothetical protein JW839_08710 [Candidatus Lokiarchaeota archaeon]|nr:hypothetical protein [Candidatus Lokiarchaeota archaeon]
MTVISGKLVVDEDKKLCINMQLTPANPELVDIPIDELLEEYLGKTVHIEILPVEPRWKRGGA